MSRAVAACAVAALAALTLMLWIELDRPVVRVKVEGRLDAAERAEVRATVAATIDGGLLSANLNALSASIRALSWPRSVSIRRLWPDTLEIEVRKPTVVAAWHDAYLGSDGEIVRLPGERPDLPVFECQMSPPRFAMEVYHRFNSKMAGAGPVDVAGLEIERLVENALGEWSITFDDGVTLMLGAEHTSERLERFLTVYRARLAERFDEVARVDARYANGVAVSWREAKPGSDLLALDGGAADGRSGSGSWNKQ